MDHLEIPSFQIKTYGCKVNTYDTGLLQGRLVKAGFTEKNAKPGIYILNTCAVTAEATREAVRYIRSLKAKDPFCTVVITGCGAQVDTDAFKNLPGVDLVVANSHKGKLEEIIRKYFARTLTEKVFHSNIFKKEDLEAGGGIEKGHTRGFLKIQDGCNSFCTYCVIPFARGKSRSIERRELALRVNELYLKGIREVVLTGVHIGDYESKENGEIKYLEDLIEYLLEKTQITRFRLSSLEPIEVSEKLLLLFKNPRLCPHFHMSIQSANTKVLREMKRKYTAEKVEESLLQINQFLPNAFVGMDVIVGFPGETDEEFQDSYDRLKKLPWSRIHVFPYSVRPGTKAASIENHVPQHVIYQRSQILRDLSSERYKKEALNQVGKIKKALVLKNQAKGLQALTEDYWPVFFENTSALPERGLTGQEVEVCITGYDNSHQSRMDGFLTGELLFKEQ